MAVTIKDVAELAGVSISTVSRVINNSKPVSSVVRRKVLEAIDELDYEPNQVARSLVTKKSNLIGIVLTDIGNHYIARMVRGMEEIGRMYNYDIILSSSFGDSKREIELLELLKGKQVEGIIFISEGLNESALDTIKELNIPSVYLNKYYKNNSLPSVSIDNFEGTYKMTEYLQKLGHEKILYINNNNEDENSIEKIKTKGYKKALKGKGLEEFVLSVDGFKVEDGYNIGNNIMKLVREKGITAVFCNHDEIAIGLINYCYDNNIKVPEDVSISGFGDTELASIYRPSLTTVREPYYDIGAVAIRRIIKEIDEDIVEEDNTYLPFHIMERKSTKGIKS